MAPISSGGENAFWDHFGRKFIPVKYAEADRFCQHNRRFIPELLPREEIYLSLFPLEVQNLIGEVAPETQPARRLLESMGFRYRGMIDPFDGGPHLEANTDELELVRATSSHKLAEPATEARLSQRGIVSTLSLEGEFRAVETEYSIDRAGVHVGREAFEALKGVAGGAAGVTPVHGPGEVKAKPAAARSARSRVRA
jgi:arginine N-succinyltransferase